MSKSLVRRPLLPLRSRLEAALFSTIEAVSFEKLAEAVSADPGEVRRAVRDLQYEYDSLLRPRGVGLVVHDDEVEMVSAPLAADVVEKMRAPEQVERERELSEVALETLAIVAYRGPVTRDEVEQIRGVQSGRVLRQLMIEGLIEEVRSVEDESAPEKYQVSADFFAQAGVSQREELPNFDDLSVDDLIGEDE